MTVQLLRRPFTVDEYYAMAEAGILSQDDFYTEALPTPADTILVIEVADSSLTYDQQVKIPLYARHDVPEVWLVDLSRELIERYREPSPQGYQQVIQVRRGQEMAPQSFADLTLPADDLLG